MSRYIKAQLASVIATGIDFSVTVLLTEFAGIYYLISTLAGGLSGALFHFGAGRNWVFKAKTERYRKQLKRYSLFWTGNLLLNVSGTWMFTECVGVSYFFSKIVTSLIVGLSYSYYMQKSYVFSE